MTLELLTGFDGAAPAMAAGLRQEGPGRFLVFPGRRARPGLSEEAPGQGSRLAVRLRNTGRRALPVVLVADWEGDARTAHHDLGYVRLPRQRAWRMIPGLRARNLVEYRFTAPPGVTRLGLYPDYNCQDGLAFIRRLAPVAEVTAPGRSREGRPIHQVRFPSTGRQAAAFLLQARDHAYETAGSYCVEGIADFLLSGSAMADYLRSKFTVTMLPMTNPDGVHNGLSRLTHETGADLNRVLTAADPAHAAVQAVIDSVRPEVHMNLHNWTAKFTDGLLVGERPIAERIIGFMPDDTAHYKRWRIETLADYLAAARLEEVPEAAKSWKDYCRERFGAVAVTFEFPWFGLDPAMMREKGARAFTALALAVIEERNL